jgi:type I restriction enzyme S subunit
MKKIKLGDVLIKKNLRLKDAPHLKDPLVLGVTNNQGVVKSKVEAGQKIEDYFVIEKGDFVYNPYRVNVGSIGISDLEGITSLAYVVFNVDETRLNKYLLFKLLKSELGIKEIVRNGRGSVRNALRFEDLAKIELTLPSIQRQNEFIENFKQKEEKIEKLKSLYSYQLTLLENLNQAILQEAVQGKLVKQDTKDEPATELLKRIKAEKAKSGKKAKPLPPIKPEEIPFEIPENWVWCRLGEIANLKSGNQYQLNPSSSGIMFVKVGDMNSLENDYEIKVSSTYYTKNDINERDLIPKNSIIFPKRGGAIATNKRRVVLTEQILIDSNTMAVTPEFCIDFKYFFFWFSNIDLSKLGNDGVIPQVNNKDIDPLLFPLPPLSEQKRIVVELEKQLSKTKQLKEHIIANQRATEQLLKALLHQAFEVEEKGGG